VQLLDLVHDHALFLITCYICIQTLLNYPSSSAPLHSLAAVQHSDQAQQARHATFSRDDLAARPAVVSAQLQGSNGLAQLLVRGLCVYTSVCV
jgi:hypothetical protein